MLLGAGAQALHPDSLRTRWINGKKYTLHKVAPKETFSSLSRRYQVSLQELQKANPGVVGLKIGQIVNVPVLSGAPEPAPAAAEPKGSADQPAPPKQSSPTTTQKTHTVQKGETLYRISKLYNTSIDELKKLNGLASNNVSIGQKIKVPAGALPAFPERIEPVTPAPVPREEAAPSSGVAATRETPAPPVRETPKDLAKETPKEAVKETPKEEVKETPKAATPSASVDTPKTSAENAELPKVYSNPGTSRSSVIEKDPKSGTEIERVTEVGVATWITEGDMNQNKFYALHRTAPTGTIIKVTNRMNNNSVFVKVVGPLPDTGDNISVIIKITQAAAQRIGAIDQKFTAELSYGLSR